MAKVNWPHRAFRLFSFSRFFYSLSLSLYLYIYICIIIRIYICTKLSLIHSSFLFFLKKGKLFYSTCWIVLYIAEVFSAVYACFFYFIHIISAYYILTTCRPSSRARRKKKVAEISGREITIGSGAHSGQPSQRFLSFHISLLCVLFFVSFLYIFLF